MRSSPAQALSLSPLSAEKSALAAQLVQDLDAQALHWLSGYMAGAAANQTLVAAAIAPAPATEPDKVLTIVYGSQTGNSKRVAEDLARRAEQTGLTVKLVRTDAYRTSQLKKEQLLYVVISTHSEGDTVEPPDDSREFMEFLQGRRAPILPNLRYAVLALGDTSYPDFCGIGRQVDERLAALGATRLQARGEADVDVDTVAGPWAQQALEQALEEAGPVADNAAPTTTRRSVVTPLHPAATAWTRQHPFTAEILASQRIVGSDSAKDVRHIELSLEGSGIIYQPGDALGVWPHQAAELVSAVVARLALDGDQQIEHDGETMSLAQWLGERRELTALTRPFLQAHAELGRHDDLAALLEADQRAAFTELLETHQLLDVLKRWPAPWDGESLVAALRSLAPRMYSIASSQAVVGEEVHLTVERLSYTRDDEQRWGVATRYLLDLEEGDRVPVFIDGNDRFRLPEDSSRDVIMIGPGTGVAPFRAFVQEREETDADGRQWLFFGNPHRRSDFLYQLEWQRAVNDGALDRLSVAFSRDQAHKIYVQDRLRENGRKLWAWLDGGAHLYVCGDADRMAPDVHRALVEIVAEHGGKAPDEAATWLKQRMTEGRYARDVY